MKKLITLLCLIVYIQTIKAQFVTIPDANFVTWLQTNVPSAMNGNQLDTTSLAVTTRANVTLFNLNISDLTGVQYFSSLDTFVCISNPINGLPNLSNTVKHINIYGGQLTNLPMLPSSLTYLRCVQNQLTNLPILPPSLIQLFCSDNQLTSLPSLPNSITTIECQNNLLTSLPGLPSSLIYFSCAFNQLTLLPSLPSSLNFLNCSNNNISNLPVLSSSLTVLICSSNQLISLPTIPNLVTNIDCSYNQLTNLPVLPSSLYSINCSHNQLSSLPTLPVALSMLNCSYNQLTSLPNLPINLISLVCSNNLITCFPIFPNIPSKYIQTPGPPILAFDIDNNPFSCLPNYVGGMDAVILNYPLCVSGNTLTNINGCIAGGGISGTVFRDLNSDCFNNSNELGLMNATVKLYDSLYVFMGLTNSGTNGLYNFNVSAGTYHVLLDTINKPYVVQCINPGIDSLITLSIAQQLEDSVDFAVQCKQGFDVGVQSIYKSGAVFPGVTHTLTVMAGDMTHWSNLNCATGVSGTVSFSVNGPVAYVGSVAGSLTPSVVGNVYTYTVSDFGSINNLSDFKLIFSTDTNAQALDVICVSATVNPIIGDLDSLNNYYLYCYPVSNSLDPNIKEVYPTEVQTGFSDWLTYTIHFQNTGNAPAINIRLEDQLDVKLDPETFQLINYSHYNIIDLTGNHLTVRFPNIQLVDSTSNPQGSIGFVQYRIKPKTSWVNDTIRNSANIYFDYNAPIITNSAKSYFMTVTDINDIRYLSEDVGVSPNPSNNLVAVTGRFDFEKIQLLNITGQVLLSETVNARTHELQLQNYAAGIYFIKISYPNGLSTVKKVVKQ